MYLLDLDPGQKDQSQKANHTFYPYTVCIKNIVNKKNIYIFKTLFFIENNKVMYI